MFKIEQIEEIFSKYSVKDGTDITECSYIMNSIFKDIIDIDNKEHDIKIKEFYNNLSLFCDNKREYANLWFNDVVEVRITNFLYNLIIKLSDQKEIKFNYPQIIEFCKMVNSNVNSIIDKNILQNITLFKNCLYPMVTGLFHKYEDVDKSLLIVNDKHKIFSSSYNFCYSIFIKTKCLYVDVDCFHFTDIDQDILKNFDDFGIPYKIKYNNDFLFIKNKQWININGSGKVEYKGIRKNSKYSEYDDYKVEILKRCRLKKLKNLIN